MSTSDKESSRTSADRRRTRASLPPIGIWWPLLDWPFKREILQSPGAPLSRKLLDRVYQLCGRDLALAPAGAVLLGPNERAYISAWERITALRSA